tara:strand:+ start:33047 stop:35326 length:2280 start_codon:yes stop_codon:yes gene_type:complete
MSSTSRAANNAKFLNASFNFFCLVASVWVLSTLPRFSLILGIGLLGYFAMLLYRPLIALLLIPTVLTSFDLTPWLGWSLVNELDAFLLVTCAAVGLRSRPVNPPVLPSKNPDRMLFWGVGLWLAGWGVAFFAAGGWPDEVTRVPDQIFYFSPEYGLSQVKAPLYALLLWRLWRRLQAVNGAKATDYFFYGALLASVVLFSVVTWERGVWQPLLSSGAYYARLSALLDFTSSYRITGLLSAMHTGGEAIDGTIVLLLALVMGGAYHYSGGRRLSFIGVTLLLLYCLIATFTRTTYASLMVMVVVGGVLLWRQRALLPKVNRQSAPIPLLLLAATATVISLWLLYRHSGYLGVAAGYGMLGFGFLGTGFVFFRSLNRWFSALVYCAGIGLGLYAQLTSKWIEAGPQDIVNQLLLLLLIAGMAHLLSAFLVLNRTAMLSSFMTLLVASFLLVVTLGSYRMTERLSDVGGDLQTRVGHWSDVLAARSGGLKSALIGMGPGSYPSAYAITHADKVRHVGSFAFDDSGLLLGYGNDLKFSQRIPVVPNRDYIVKLDFSSASKSELFVGFCQRNMLLAQSSYFNCVNVAKRVDKGDRQQITFTINSGRVGKGSVLTRWPTEFYISNQWNSVVHIDSVQVTLDGVEQLINGELQGGAHWYFYNDFEHLPWHMKNLPLAVFFERGLLGVIGTLLLVGVPLSRVLKTTQQVDGVIVSGVLGIAGMLAVGMMGNPLDSVRIAILFYWLILVLTGSMQVLSAPSVKQRIGS